ncbi:MAG TPA: hypothetical protein VN682_24230 [Terriglobales bacterium]|jgi:hypothetical protein|nr:hypothetical protein [Terriglobales bacterium]
MAPEIEVKNTGENTYAVRVIQGKSESTHRVTLEDKDYTRLTDGNVTPEELIRRSFEFLLEHESKESILESFDLMVISRYFPQYEREIKKRIASA